MSDCDQLSLTERQRHYSKAEKYKRHYRDGIANYEALLMINCKLLREWPEKDRRKNELQNR